MKHLFNALKTLALSIFIVTALALPALAVDPKQPLCEGSGGTWNGTACAGAVGEPTVPSTFGLIANLLLFVIGAIAVIMIIIGGIRYVSANGDQGQVTEAKNTILYAIIGLVVAISAYAIVTFVATKFQSSGGTTPPPATPGGGPIWTPL